jgi:hypothetical protein
MTGFIHRVTILESILIALVVQFFWHQSIVAADKSSTFRGDLRKLRPATSVLGDKWERMYGIVVDDVSDLSALTATERKAVDALGITQVAKQIGATALADFSYQGPGMVVPQIVTLRVIVFVDHDRAMRFWNDKYESDGWEKTYRRVNQKERTLDVIGSAKRIALRANVLLTCHQLIDGEEHRKVIEDSLKLLEDALDHPPSGRNRESKP